MSGIDGDGTTSQVTTTDPGQELPGALPIAELVPEATEDVERAMPGGAMELGSSDGREIVVLLHKWGDVAELPNGLETFMPGAFADVDPTSVVLQAQEHGPAAGRGTWLEERADGAYMGLRASKTAAGDDLLTLARDQITKHISVVYDPRHTKAVWQSINGRRVVAITKAALRAVSTTWKPYYTQTAVLAVRAREEERVETAPITPEAVAATTGLSNDPANAANGSIMASVEAMFSRMEARLSERVAALEERARTTFEIPAGQPADRKVTRGEWMGTVLKLLSGERLPEYQMRDLADLITTDNAGVVPDAFSTELIGIIDPSRPFMDSTRKLDTPTQGMSLVVPKLITRPTVGVQATEKTELTSTATAIDTVDFPAVTKGGAGDISLQLLKRSSPSFLGLYLELLAEAYAIDADDEALDALLAEAAVVEGGSIDPEATSFGSAWANSYAAMRRRPNRIWLSSTAVAAFIDAKAGTTNQPLYPNLVSSDTGLSGSIGGMTPVHVPALDNEAVDIVVGPSAGFAWAEDGTYTLQVDVPAKAGRDVALVGILWFAPLYPAAFTTYTLAA